MGTGTLTIYSASAGSGKTFQLARIYLSRLFKSRYSYRKILAVTFTNKATAEMKGRILDQLNFIATGRESEYLAELIESTGKSEKTIRMEAREILFNILHDFSRFSVCTIDSFFQKVLRAFTREAGLHTGFNIELDHSMILSRAVEEMIASSVNNPELQNWLNDYVMSNLEEEKSWNLKTGIMQLSEELFREKFKMLSEKEMSDLENKEYLLSYKNKIRSLISLFEETLLNLGKKCEKIFHDFNLSDEMFFQKSKGIPGYIRSLAAGKVTKPGSSVREILKDPPRWSTKNNSEQLQNAIRNGLEETIKEAIRFDDENRKVYSSAKVIHSNIYALGILSDVLKRVHQVATSENSFLLSDAGELLSLITGGDQTPFIYEKIGNQFENYMIDEFQDTSRLQWRNFEPLIDNSMGEGNDNLVVGDIKQSIYRWRNSDWQILERMQEELVDQKRFLSKPLKTNWRSRTNIIKFNNSLFSLIPAQIDRLFRDDLLPVRFSDLYSESIQDDPFKGSGGYVRLEFIDNEPEPESESSGKRRKVSKKWDEIVLEKLPSVIESFQSKGYKASDIGILVRERKEGEAVLRTMIEYAGSCSQEQKNTFNYNIVSNDSLTLSNSYVIAFIIAVLRVLNNPEDLISRAQMLRFYLSAKSLENVGSIPLNREKLIDSSHGYFPEKSEEFLESARQMPLFEATEKIISHFSLGNYPWNVVYLNTFQDWVLNFSKNKNADFQSFLEWWDATGSTKSVILPANQDAAKVYTIHKAKGLEFKIVILPFLSWNLDHKPSKQPILWVRPDISPFNELGIIPIKYNQALADTIFAGDYNIERYSSYLDNINLLYVAMTRAMDVIYGFVPETQVPNNGIGSVIKNAIVSDENIAKESGIILKTRYNEKEKVFEYGVVPEYENLQIEKSEIKLKKYLVNQKPESLKLKLHGENYFSGEKDDIRQRISYGKLMHEVFEGINAAGDISSAVKKLVLEGKVPEYESGLLEKKLNSLISVQPVSDWFKPGNNVLKEAEILLPSGNTKRPDRIIIREKKVIIIDFKFGGVNPVHSNQIKMYRDLLTEMGYENIEAFLWYVDDNKVITV